MSRRLACAELKLDGGGIDRPSGSGGNFPPANWETRDFRLSYPSMAAAGFEDRQRDLNVDGARPDRRQQPVALHGGSIHGGSIRGGSKRPPYAHGGGKQPADVHGGGKQPADVHGGGKQPADVHGGSKQPPYKFHVGKRTFIS